MERIKAFILGVSRLAKGWREGVMVRVAMMVGGASDSGCFDVSALSGEIGGLH